MRASRQSRRSRQKILVIEDDPVARAELEARLEANGYIVARAADAASAMTVVNRERPDLILLDLGLPAGDGFLVLERLRKIETLAAIPVLAVTGRSDPETRKRVEALGVPPVLVKPVQTEALMAASSASVCRSEEHTSELQSQSNLVCRLLLEKKKNNDDYPRTRQLRSHD